MVSSFFGEVLPAGAELQPARLAGGQSDKISSRVIISNRAMSTPRRRGSANYYFDEAIVANLGRHQTLRPSAPIVQC